MSDPRRALGPEPEGRLHLTERRCVELVVEEVLAELRYIARAHERWDTAHPALGHERGPRHDLRHGIERGLDHGPSLGMGR